MEAALSALLLADAAVAAAIGARLFPNAAPLGTATPYATFRRISGRRVRSLAGASGLAMPRVQIDVQATSYLAARAAADAIRRCLDGYRPAGNAVIRAAALLSDQDLYEAEALPPLHRVTMDFQITHREE